MNLRNAAALTAALGIAAVLTNGVAAAKPRHSGSVVARADRKFMINAARGGMTEVRLGKVAERRAASEAVKRFGRHMVTDHSAANRKLMHLAQRKHVVLPMGVGEKHRKNIARLSRLSGVRFDRAYAADMVEDHEKDVAEFRRAARTAQDPDVRAFAAQTLPTLQEHLRMARDLHADRGAMKHSH